MARKKPDPGHGQSGRVNIGGIANPMLAGHARQMDQSRAHRAYRGTNGSRAKDEKRGEWQRNNRDVKHTHTHTLPSLFGHCSFHSSTSLLQLPYTRDLSRALFAKSEEERKTHLRR